MFHCCMNSDVPLLYEFRCFTVVWIQILDVPPLYEFRCFTVVWIQILDVSLLYGYVPLLYEFRCFTVVWIQILDVSLLYGCSTVVWIQWSCKVRKTLSACNVWCVNLVNESVYSQTCLIDYLLWEVRGQYNATHQNVCKFYIKKCIKL